MVLLTRAPVRISFGGGGTDLPVYYERYGGVVVSTTIDYYVYVMLAPAHRKGLQIVSADYGTLCERPAYEELIWDGDLRLPKAITYYFNIRDGVSIFIASQVPPGTGLGSSGSVSVAMIKALAFWCGLDLAPAEVAELACYIEIQKMDMPVGKQDQYAAAFGGLNTIVFSREGVVVEPLRVSPEVRQALQERLMLFYTGASRQSSTILRRQARASQEEEENTIQRLNAIKEIALEMRAAIEQGDLDTFGGLLHCSWLQKRGIVEGITTPFLDQCYQTAREHGALGGKITGAGGGGFLLLYCPPQRQEEVTQALVGLGLQPRHFALEQQGVQIMEALPCAQTKALHHRRFSRNITTPARAGLF